MGYMYSSSTLSPPFAMGSPYILKMLHRVPNKIIWISSFLKQSDLFRRGEEEGKKKGENTNPAPEIYRRQKHRTQLLLHERENKIIIKFKFSKKP
jgi:hypothetical protein